MAEHEAIARRLREIGQEHLLRFHDELSPERRRLLLERIEGLPLESVPRLIEEYVKQKPDFSPRGKIEPAAYYPADPKSSRRSWNRDSFRAKGEALLKMGRVGVFTVAGGQGTRLGFDGPKGCYPATPAHGKPLFMVIAEWIRAASARYGATIPWYIMTSPANHDDTVSFFRDQNQFGLKPQSIMHFQQGVMPSFDAATGKILLAEKDEPATNPDGHGGSLRALYVSGAIDDMRHRGVEHISYVQIDNPMVKPVDPVFIGLHAAAPDSSGEMSSKMVEKTEPSEKVGVFSTVDGRVQVIEYSDLPDELAQQRDDAGALRFNAGSPAIHLIGVEFVARLNEKGDDGLSLPFHRADKKVPHVDLATGKKVEPDSANGVKLEMFVFDALPLAEKSIVLETLREDEFAPIKNAEGVDSPASSRRLQSGRGARWLESAGVRVARNEDGSPACTIEISPLKAMGPEDLKGMALPKEIEPGATFVLE
ncbi:MAG: UDPGP type 1 family protein [Planctomycetota bacterium]|nr:UDPGP type 1 family protein [Planctomycetota bacterium]